MPVELFLLRILSGFIYGIEVPSRSIERKNVRPRFSPWVLKHPQDLYNASFD